SGRAKVKVERDGEGGRSFVDLLRLAYRDRGTFAGKVPSVAHLQMRHVPAVLPLLEELLQVSARRLLQRPAEIARLDAFPLVVAQVLRHAAPEYLLAQLVAQHVQDPGALVVNLAAGEPIDLLCILKTEVDHRFAGFARIERGDPASRLPHFASKAMR